MLAGDTERLKGLKMIRMIRLWIKQLEHSKRDADGNKQFHGASVADCYFASLYFTVYTIRRGLRRHQPVNAAEMVVNTLFISRNMARVANYRKLEGMMSYALRGEAAAANNLMWLKRVWYLSSARGGVVASSRSRSV
ncbi:hypothetical protein SO694_00115038 [Aureococcus anophagefferens]|uniref:Uncharacterized protein n=1 Tax=Aureococcus anophagefferens TaxID=44056 RepID=A0ABR1FWN0_AURAN